MSSNSGSVFSAFPPRPSVYWGELIERDGIEAALECAMSRISFFTLNDAASLEADGWSHLQETQDLLGEIALAVRRG